MDIKLIKDLKQKHGFIIKEGTEMTVSHSKWQELLKSGHVQGEEKKVSIKEPIKSNNKNQ